jgi:hypothetical protein
VLFGNGDDKAVQPSIGKQLVGERVTFQVLAPWR